MQPKAVTEVLEGDQRGIQHPKLEVLNPSIDDYDVLLYQPKGEIEASATYVRNKSRDLANTQASAFLQEAAQRQVSLAISPEYCLPWESVIQAINAGVLPAETALWALGCESLTLPELDGLQARLGNSAHVVHEQIDRDKAAKKGFLDPLTYIFNSKDKDGADCVVVLIQFKAHVSIDEDRIEGDNLYCGNSIYTFGVAGQTVRLASLICSDAFEAHREELKDLYDRTLFLHIQLNPKPRHSSFCDYRKYLFKHATDTTEIICLNWASHIKSWKTGEDHPNDWNNIGGSAWYLRPTEFNTKDPRVKANHLAGLYYTYLKSQKWHVLYFNYDPGIYFLKTSKVWQHDVDNAQRRRTGPRLERVLRWNDNENRWDENSTSDDRFEDLLRPHGKSVEQLSTFHAHCPILVERFLALTAGKVYQPDNWYSVTELDSFLIDERELIRRITFAQDPETEMLEFRRERVRQFIGCNDAIGAFTDWPPVLNDMASGCEFEWDERFPHNNVVSKEGQRATLVYFGENRLAEELLSIGETLRLALLRLQQPKDRIGIFHRAGQQLLLWIHPNIARFDKPSNSSPADITGS